MYFKLLLSLFSLFLASCASKPVTEYEINDHAGSVGQKFKSVLSIPEGFAATAFCKEGRYEGNNGIELCTRDGQYEQIYFKSFDKNKAQQINNLIQSVPANERFSRFSSEVFASYCSNGKQQLPMEENVTVVLPMLPIGLPLDTASNFSSKLQSFAEDAVKSIFFQNIKIQKDWRSNQDGPPKYYGLELSKNKLEDMFVEQRVSGKKNDEGSFIIISDNKSIIVGWMPEVLEYEFEQDQSVLHQKNNYVVSDDNRVERIGYVPSIQNRPIFIMDKYGSGKTLLRAAYYFDLFVLGNSFAISENENNGNVNIARTISRRDSNWRKYLNENISVKSAQTDNPQVLKYIVSLDLSSFCSNAKFLESLTSN